ncbi:MAG: GNAT family N-acetyltransferase [Ignavibacteria bacterium]|nr:GNAT family N-acetyltransferase [Ignavibacteria bacterium]
MISEKNHGEYFVTNDVTRMDLDAIHDWITNSYWAKGRTKEAMKKVIDNSLNFALFHKDKQIGFARVVTDYHTFAYLCDVIVDEKYRGKGLGKLLMKEVMNYPDTKIMKRWFLFTKDAHGLYAQYGFGPFDMPERSMVKKNPEVS